MSCRRKCCTRLLRTFLLFLPNLTHRYIALSHKRLGTHRITYHSAAASLITYLQRGLFCDIIRKSEVCIMSESRLRDLSMEFSVDIIELVKYLKSVKESIISNQIGRSGTSIGPNIH